MLPFVELSFRRSSLVRVPPVKCFVFRTKAVGGMFVLYIFCNILFISVILKMYIQSNFNGSNTFGTMKISSRQG